jgi:hypothetical protein
VIIQELQKINKVRLCEVANLRHRLCDLLPATISIGIPNKQKNGIAVSPRPPRDAAWNCLYYGSVPASPIVDLAEPPAKSVRVSLSKICTYFMWPLATEMLHC